MRRDSWTCRWMLPALRRAKCNGCSRSATLDAALLPGLRALSERAAVPLLATCVASLGALISRYTGCDDVVLAASTDSDDVQPLRIDLSGDPDFCRLLSRAGAAVRDAQANRFAPIDALARAALGERDVRQTSLAQVVVRLWNAQTAPATPPPPAAAPTSRVAPTDWAFTFSADRDALRVALDYNAALFRPETAASVLEHLEVLLRGCVANPEGKIAFLPLLGAAERQRLLVEFNATAVEYPRDRGIHEVVESQVERTPDAVAVVFGEQRLTYRELNSRANQLAHYLRDLGIGPNALVGIFMQRALEMPVAVLAVLKAGGAYVPIDPNFPKDRVAFMVEDTQAPSS